MRQGAFCAKMDRHFPICLLPAAQRAAYRAMPAGGYLEGNGLLTAIVGGYIAGNTAAATIAA